MQAWWPAYAQSFNYASWSLTVEIFFYAIFPFFVLWAYRQPVRRMLWAAVIFWIITQIINYVLWVGYFPAQELIILYNPVFHLSTFILGVAGGAWFMQEGRHQIIDQRINFFILVFTLALITIYAILSETYQQLPHFLQPLMGTLAPLFVLFISALALDQTRLSKILSHKWLVALGETSYALYILHVPVIWLYERALHSSGLQDPEYIKSLTSFPLMILIGLIVTFYIEPPARAWLKNIVKQISIPLLLLDMVILTVSIFLSFRLRFDTEREYLAYREMGILIFWSAFFFRNIISYFFNTLSPDLLHKPILEMGRQLLFSTAAGSLVVSLIVLMGYRAGWYINFPRSVFMADFLIVFVLSFLIRYIFRVSNLYRPAVTA